ncbi:hypothetical protein Peur_065689 [Populus x canadensis]
MAAFPQRGLTSLQLTHEDIKRECMQYMDGNSKGQLIGSGGMESDPQSNREEANKLLESDLASANWAGKRRRRRRRNCKHREHIRGFEHTNGLYESHLRSTGGKTPSSKWMFSSLQTQQRLNLRKEVGLQHLKTHFAGCKWHIHFKALSLPL